MSSAKETEYRSLIADTDFSNQAVDQYTFVAIGPATNGVGYDQGNAAMVAWESGDYAYGILLTAPPQGAAGTVRIRGCELVRCGQAWTVGQMLAPMAGGLCGPAGSGVTPRGVAVNSAVIGDLGMIELF